MRRGKKSEKYRVWIEERKPKGGHSGTGGSMGMVRSFSFLSFGISLPMALQSVSPADEINESSIRLVEVVRT